MCVSLFLFKKTRTHTYRKLVDLYTAELCDGKVPKFVYSDYHTEYHYRYYNAYCSHSFVLSICGQCSALTFSRCPVSIKNIIKRVYLFIFRLFKAGVYKSAYIEEADLLSQKQPYSLFVCAVDRCRQIAALAYRLYAGGKAVKGLKIGLFKGKRAVIGIFISGTPS